MGAQGTTTVDFGAFPGSAYASAVVTGQAGIVAGSLVEAWLYPIDTTDHLADEHLIEKIRVVAGNIVPGTGFTIHATSANDKSEPDSTKPHETSVFTASATTIGVKTAAPGVDRAPGGGQPMVYGLWTVAWVWN